MGISRGNITTNIIKKGLVFNMDAANRASTIPSTSTLKTFNTIDLSQSGSIVTDATWEAGSPSSFDFDGSDGYIQCQDLSVLTSVTQFTLNWWILTKDRDADHFLFGNRASNGGMAFQTHSSGNYFYFRNSDGSNSWATFSISNFPEDEWFNFCIVFNGSQSSDATKVKIYVNGSAISLSFNGTIPTSIPSGADPFQIAQDYLSSTYWNGNINSFNIYNRALSASEVLFNYNGLKSRFGL